MSWHPSSGGRVYYIITISKGPEEAGLELGDIQVLWSHHEHLLLHHVCRLWSCMRRLQVQVLVNMKALESEKFCTSKLGLDKKVHALHCPGDRGVCQVGSITLERLNTWGDLSRLGIRSVLQVVGGGLETMRKILWNRTKGSHLLGPSDKMWTLSDQFHIFGVIVEGVWKFLKGDIWCLLGLRWAPEILVTDGINVIVYVCVYVYMFACECVCDVEWSVTVIQLLDLFYITA